MQRTPILVRGSAFLCLGGQPGQEPSCNELATCVDEVGHRYGSFRERQDTWDARSPITNVTDIDRGPDVRTHRE